MRKSVFIIFLGFSLLARCDIYSWGRDNPCDPVNGGCRDIGFDLIDESDLSWEDVPQEDLGDEGRDIADCNNGCLPGSLNCGEDQRTLLACQLGENGCYSFLPAGECEPDYICHSDLPYCISPEIQVSTGIEVITTGVKSARINTDRWVTIWLSGESAAQITQIKGAVFDSRGSLISSIFRVEPLDTCLKSPPEIAVFNNDRFIILWATTPNSTLCLSREIFAAIFSSTGSLLLSAFRVGQFSTEIQEAPQISLLGPHQMVIVWQSSNREGSEYGKGIYGAIFNSQGGRLAEDFQVNLFSTNNQTSPRLAALDENRFVVAWESNHMDGDLKGVYGRVFQDHTPQTPDFLVNQMTSGEQMFPNVLSLSESRFVVTWSFLPSLTFSDVVARLFDSLGNPLSSEVVINQHTQGIQFYPRVIPIGSKRLLFTWTFAENCISDCESSRALVRIYDQNLSPYSSEISIGSQQANISLFPQAIGLNDFNWVMTWISSVDDLSGIYQQVFLSDGRPASSEFYVNPEAVLASSPVILEIQKDRYAIIWSSIDGPDDDHTHIRLRIFQGFFESF